MPTRPNSNFACATKAKDLIAYIYSITDAIPRKYKFNIWQKIQNNALEVLESLIMANEIMIGVTPEDNKERRNLQHKALAKLKVIDSLILIARECECIVPKKYEVISRLVSDCANLTGAWINSDKKRIQK